MIIYKNNDHGQYKKPEQSRKKQDQSDAGGLFYAIEDSKPEPLQNKRNKNRQSKQAAIVPSPCHYIPVTVVHFYFCPLFLLPHFVYVLFHHLCHFFNKIGFLASA